MNKIRNLEFYKELLNVMEKIIKMNEIINELFLENKMINIVNPIKNHFKDGELCSSVIRNGYLKPTILDYTTNKILYSDLIYPPLISPIGNIVFEIINNFSEDDPLFKEVERDQLDFMDCHIGVIEEHKINAPDTENKISKFLVYYINDVTIDKIKKTILFLELNNDMKNENKNDKAKKI